MTLDGLIEVLQPSFQVPQKAERWAVYRLIGPIVDYANATLGLTVFFEFNQTSAHGTSQSVDIALLSGSDPRVLIEAKRVGRTLTADQVAKYLTPGTRGIVTDGFRWILCSDGRSTSVAVYEGSAIQADALQGVVDFIRGASPSAEQWPQGVEPARTPVPTLKIKKPTRGVRKPNPSTEVTTPDDLANWVQNLSVDAPVQQALLDAVTAALEGQRSFPPGMFWKVRSSRLSVFNDAVQGQGGSHRVARIDLTGKLPDMLVLNSIVNANPALSAIAPPSPHDKHPGMRRYRLGSIEQARQFGRALAEALSGSGHEVGGAGGPSE
jgi:hypothetical protein